MSGGDVAERSHKGKGKKKKGRRLGIRMDMTPLVDVALLLLTFFMFTTSMSRPQTMEINLPPDPNQRVDIPESTLLTIRVSAKEEIYWNMALDPPKRIEFSALRAFLKEKSIGIPKLVTLLKIDRTGKFNTMVNMIDEMNLSQIQRFSLAPLLETDKALMAKAQ